MQPTRNLTIPGQTVVSYKDLSPRMGLAYDIFGNGKTAVKVSLNRYVQDLSLLANALYSNQQNYQTTATRSWTAYSGVVKSKWSWVKRLLMRPSGNLL